MLREMRERELATCYQSPAQNIVCVAYGWALASSLNCSLTYVERDERERPRDEKKRDIERQSIMSEAYGWL